MIYCFAARAESCFIANPPSLSPFSLSLIRWLLHARIVTVVGRAISRLRSEAYCSGSHVSHASYVLVSSANARCTRNMDLGETKAQSEHNFSPVQVACACFTCVPVYVCRKVSKWWRLVVCCRYQYTRFVLHTLAVTKRRIYKQLTRSVFLIEI